MKTIDEVKTKLGTTASRPQCCAHCWYAAQMPVDANLKRQLVCRRRPPQPIAVQTPHGVAASTVSTLVQPETWCGQFMDGEPSTLEASSTLGGDLTN